MDLQIFQLGGGVLWGFFYAFALCRIHGVQGRGVLLLFQSYKVLYEFEEEDQEQIHTSKGRKKKIKMENGNKL
jgi:hypothetical protein